MHIVTGPDSEACTTPPGSLGPKELILNVKTQHDEERDCRRQEKLSSWPLDKGPLFSFCSGSRCASWWEESVLPLDQGLVLKHSKHLGAFLWVLLPSAGQSRRWLKEMLQNQEIKNPFETVSNHRCSSSGLLKAVAGLNSQFPSELLCRQVSFVLKP